MRTRVPLFLTLTYELPRGSGVVRLFATVRCYSLLSLPSASGEVHGSCAILSTHTSVIVNGSPNLAFKIWRAFLYPWARGSMLQHWRARAAFPVHSCINLASLDPSSSSSFSTFSSKALMKGKYPMGSPSNVDMFTLGAWKTPMSRDCWRYNVSR